MTASANNVTVTPNFITDGSGGVWGLSPSSTSGQQVCHNGVIDTTTSNVTLLLYNGGIVYHGNIAGNFYSYNGTWSLTGDPRVESVNGTSVTTVGPAIIDSTLEKWTLVLSATASVGMQIAVNGVLDTTTNNVTLLIYENHRVYQENTYGDWWYKPNSSAVWTQSTDPRVVTPVTPPAVTPVTPVTPVTTGVKPPAQAVAAGYTHPVLMDEFTTVSVGTDSGTYNWYTGVSTNNGSSPDWAPPLTSSDWSVNTSGTGVLTINTDLSGYGAGLFSICSSKPAVSKPGATAKNTGGGVIYQYGYFEASISFNASGYPGNGWYPAWWCSAIQGTGLQGGPTPPDSEIDFMEAETYSGNYPPVNMSCGLIEWLAGSNNLFGYTSSKTGAVNELASTMVKGAIDLSGYNIYGCLWTPTAISFYWNSAAGRAAGKADVLIQTIPTTVPTTVSGKGTFTATTATFAGPNISQVYLILGTGVNWPMHVDFVHVWQ